MEKTSLREVFAKQAYLLFFNRQLLAQGVIGEVEYAAMKRKILSKYDRIVHFEAT